MKIVFESKEEKKEFMNNLYKDDPIHLCPHEIGCKSDWDFCSPSKKACTRCWEKHANLEVENK